MSLRVNLEYLATSAAQVTGHGEDLAISHLSTDNRFAAAQAGWAGRSAEALTLRASQWAAKSPGWPSRQWKPAMSNCSAQKSWANRRFQPATNPAAAPPASSGGSLARRRALWRHANYTEFRHLCGRGGSYRGGNCRRVGGRREHDRTGLRDQSCCPRRPKRLEWWRRPRRSGWWRWLRRRSRVERLRRLDPLPGRYRRRLLQRSMRRLGRPARLGPLLTSHA
jgi:hypothetical protein